MRLKEKVVIITGAAAGIGCAAAIKIAREGARLVLVDLNEKGLNHTLELVKQHHPGTEAVIVIGDVTKEEDVQNYVNITVKQYGKIDGFFNNAGDAGPAAPIGEYDNEVFKKIVAIDLYGVFLGIKYVINVMKNQGSGSIVNTSSAGGVGALENSSPYVASKHGVIGLTRNAAVEYGKMGIRINAICPGFINTDMVKGVAAKQFPDNPQKFYDQITDGIPSGRFGEPEEIANLVSFLISDEAVYINGSVITIDGGYTAK